MEFCAVKNIKQKDTENLENLLKHFTPEISEKVLDYHKSLPNYKGRIFNRYLSHCIIDDFPRILR